MLIEKNTNQDKSAILAEAVRSLTLLTDQGCCHDWSPWMQDFDDQYVYLEVYNEGRYKTYRAKYSYTGTAATINPGALEEVVRMTEYKLVAEDTTNTLKAMFSDLLQKHFGPAKSQSTPKALIKQFKDEQMVAVEAVYIKGGDVDLHGDTLPQEELDSIVKQLNSGQVRTDLFHGVPAEAIFKINKAWINPYRCSFSETGEEVPEGQPLVEIQFLNEAAWEMRKQGKLAGLSIGGKSEWEEINE